jgi:hypothetical protein
MKHDQSSPFHITEIFPTWYNEEPNGVERQFAWGVHKSFGYIVPPNAFRSSKLASILITDGGMLPMNMPTPPESLRVSVLVNVMAQSTPIKPIKLWIAVQGFYYMYQTMCNKQSHLAHDLTEIFYFDKPTGIWSTLPNATNASETLDALTITIPPELFARNNNSIFLSPLTGIPKGQSHKRFVLPPQGMQMASEYAEPISTEQIVGNGNPKDCIVPVPVDLPEIQEIYQEKMVLLGAPTRTALTALPDAPVTYLLDVGEVFSPDALLDSPIPDSSGGRRLLVYPAPTLQSVPSYYDRNSSRWMPLPNCTYNADLHANACTLQPEFFLLQGTEVLLANLADGSPRVVITMQPSMATTTTTTPPPQRRSVTAAALPQTTPAPPSQGLSTGAIAGIVVGTVAALAVVAGALAWYFGMSKAQLGSEADEADRAPLLVNVSTDTVPTTHQQQMFRVPGSMTHFPAPLNTDVNAFLFGTPIPCRDRRI